MHCCGIVFGVATFSYDVFSMDTSFQKKLLSYDVFMLITSFGWHIEYFNHMNIEAIVRNYPHRKNLPEEDIMKGELSNAISKKSMNLVTSFKGCGNEFLSHCLIRQKNIFEWLWLFFYEDFWTLIRLNAGHLFRSLNISKAYAISDIFVRLLKINLKFVMFSNPSQARRAEVPGPFWSGPTVILTARIG